LTFNSRTQKAKKRRWRTSAVFFQGETFIQPYHIIVRGFLHFAINGAKCAG